MVSADHPPAYGYGPQIHCRNTTNAVTAEVCVPAFTEKVTEITLAVKEVQDNDYCYEQIKTVCEITETVNQHELCTYSYAPKTETLPAQVTQVRCLLLILLGICCLSISKFTQILRILKCLTF